MSDTNISDDAVKRATGRTWSQWFDLLDSWGAADAGHKATAQHLGEAHELSGWWSQMVTVEYERARGLRKLGETTSGFQMGARKTFAPDRETAWSVLMSREGLRIWLGDGAPSSLEGGQTFELADGTACEVRVLEPASHARLRWHPPQWPEASTLQVRVLEADSGRGTVSVHHEKLPDEPSRAAMKAHWRGVLGNLAKLL